MKERLLSILSLVMVIFIIGCWNISKANQEKENVTLRIAWWGTQPRHDYTLEVIELFEKKYPHIKIEPEYTNWDDYWKRLAPMAAANQLPDLVQMDLLYLKPYSDMLVDLSPFLENDIIKTEFINNEILSGGKIDQNLYGFPLGVNAPAVIVDPQLLSSTADTLLDKNWTWQEFEEAALDTHDENNIYGTNGMKPPEVFFSYYLRSNSHNLYNANGTGLGYENDQLFIEYFEMQLRLLEQGAFPKPNITEGIKGIEDELLTNQQSAMTWGYSNQYISFLKATDRPLEISVLPGLGHDTSLSVKPSMLFSVAKASKYKEEAALFLNFFINDQEANKIINGDRGVPVSTKISKALEKELSEEQRLVFDYVNDVMKNSISVEKADPIGSNEVVKLLQDISNQILFKKITPQEGAQQFRLEANKILSKNN